jgi:hypothetical protein
MLLYCKMFHGTILIPPPPIEIRLEALGFYRGKQYKRSAEGFDSGVRVRVRVP